VLTHGHFDHVGFAARARRERASPCGRRRVSRPSSITHGATSTSADGRATLVHPGSLGGLRAWERSARCGCRGRSGSSLRPVTRPGIAPSTGQIKRRRGQTTIRVQGVCTAPDLVERDFNPTEPNRLWAADITYIRTWEAGCTSLRSSTATAAGSSVGRWPITCAQSSWSTRSRWPSRATGRLRGRCITPIRPVHVADLHPALPQRRPGRLDNAAMESFHASLKKDLIHRQSWPTKAQARTAVSATSRRSTTADVATRPSACSAPQAFEASTLSPTTAKLAAPRLASPTNNDYNSTTAAQAA